MPDRRSRPTNFDPRAVDDAGTGDGIRLQKVLASAGVASRRHAEELIEAGRVRVDGKVVRVQGMRVDPEAAAIEVDGVRVVTKAGLVYLALNKPADVVSAMADDPHHPDGRPTVGDLVADRTERLFHVGRLDAESEGLLLLTNDGELGHRLSHPSYEVEKTYLAEVLGPVGRSVTRQLRSGVELEDGPVKVDSFRVVEAFGGRVMLELTLHEGRKHIVRRLLAEVGHPVRRLVRVRIGPVHLGTLKSGRVRHLTSHEVGALYKAVGL